MRELSEADYEEIQTAVDIVHFVSTRAWVQTFAQQTTGKKPRTG